MLKGIVVEAEAEEVRGVWCIIRLKGVWTESEIRERKVHQCQAKRSMIPLCPEGAQLSLSDTSGCSSNLYASVFNDPCLTNGDTDIELSRVQVEQLKLLIKMIFAE